MTTVKEDLASFGGQTLQDEVVAFGRYDDGSLYGYWHRGEALSKAPIAFMSCDISGSRVIAQNLDGFLKLVAAGDVYILSDWAATDEEGIAEGRYYEKNSLNKLRRFLKREFNILPAKFPQRIRKSAKSANPDFEKWILKLVN